MINACKDGADTDGALLRRSNAPRIVCQTFIVDFYVIELATRDPVFYVIMFYDETLIFTVPYAVVCFLTRAPLGYSAIGM